MACRLSITTEFVKQLSPASPVPSLAARSYDNLHTLLQCCHFPLNTLWISACVYSLARTLRIGISLSVWHATCFYHCSHFCIHINAQLMMSNAKCISCGLVLIPLCFYGGISALVNVQLAAMLFHVHCLLSMQCPSCGYVAMLFPLRWRNMQLCFTIYAGTYLFSSIFPNVSCAWLQWVLNGL